MMNTKFVLLRKVLWLAALLCCVSLSAVSQETIKLFDDPIDLKASMSKSNNVVMTGLPGDVVLDAEFDVADVTGLINMILNGDTSSIGDVNQDGDVDVADVTMLINRILSSVGPSVAEVQGCLDDIYRSMRTDGWATPANTHQTFGILAQTLMAEVMGDDMIMGAQGSGWFWYEANYNVKQRYTAVSWTSHFLWNSYYTWIANANYLIEANRSNTGNAYNYVLGQAYAIRAYGYFMLAQWFARTYKGHESEPCVPLFDGITFNGSTGQARSTVSEVYNQIALDIAKALTLLSGTTQQEPHHIGYAVAQGLRARIALVKEDWQTAYNAANAAINASGKTVQNVADFKGLNDATAGNVMWGAVIPTEENRMYASFWAHMRTDNMGYGKGAPKQISKWLYNKMSDTDTRKVWWKENTTGYGSDAPVQDKFMVKEGTEWDGDYIYMRIEEMYLTAAEALCRRGMNTNAKTFLNQVMSKRDPNYTCIKTGNTLGTLTTEENGSLLEEILIQRRLELWGEDGRIYTIRRLRQGFERTTENGWPVSMTQGHSWNDPECYAWVMTLPQSEFDGNPLLDPVYDQNPIGDYSVEGMHISFAERSYSATTARASLSIPLTLTRMVSKGAYSSTLKVTGTGGSYSNPSFSFSDGATTTKTNFTIRNMEIGQDYTFIVSLSDIDMNSYDPAYGEQITSMTITVQCANGNPSVQHVSFTTDNTVMDTPSANFSFSVPLTRATTEGEYRTTLSFETNDDETLTAEKIAVFLDGENTTKVWINVYGMELGTSSGVLRITDTAGAAGGEFSSTTIVVTRTVQAGHADFWDYTFGEDQGFYASVNVYQKSGTDVYYLEAPFYYAYMSVLNVEKTNWYFTLNDDGSITPVEGYWDIEIYGYKLFYDSTRYPTICYVEHDGDRYIVHYILEKDGNIYGPLLFSFVWYRE